MTMKAILVFLLPAVVLGHICMMSPRQRGSLNVNTPGESACYLKVGPCGEVPSSTPVTSIEGGKPFPIQFQQNLNHFYIDNPGKLAADIAYVADPTESDFISLGDINDYNAMNEITQTNFTLNVNIPNVASEHAVIRMRYISQNPTENDRGTTFYQCADVKIVSSTATSTDAVASTSSPSLRSTSKKPATSAANHECCAPKQFTLQGYETSSWRNPTTKSYYFDAVNQLFRVDTNSGSGTTPKDGHFQMFSNFTSGIEYYYNVNANTCDLYGLNYWSDWCYGSVNNQIALTEVKVGHEVADVWSMPGENDVFTWTNIRRDCLPMSFTRVDSGELTIFYNFVAGPPDASLFTIPATCVRAEAAMTGKSLPGSPSSHHHMKL